MKGWSRVCRNNLLEMAGRHPQGRPRKAEDSAGPKDRIELVPVVPLEELKGFLKGLVPEFQREPDRL